MVNWFDRHANNAIQWGKKSLLQMVLEKNVYPQAKEWSLTFILHHIQKLTQKGTNARFKSQNITIWEGNNPHDFVFCKDFFNMTPKAQAKEKNR